ncbi:unnamed protein product, partial [Pocillopora meandrina]
GTYLKRLLIHPEVSISTSGSHILLKTVPVNEQIEYFNCKQDYSIVVQAVANASFKFLDVSTGFPGSIHYAHVLQLSKLHRDYNYLFFSFGDILWNIS